MVPKAASRVSLNVGSAAPMSMPPSWKNLIERVSRSSVGSLESNDGCFVA